MNVHIIIGSVHENKKAFKCNICDASFTKKGNLNVPILSFKCNTCEPSFAWKYDLKEHITSVHEGKKPYECNICNTSSAKRNHLKTHGIST